MNMRRATRNSWKMRPMPKVRRRLTVDRIFSPNEYQRLQVGRIPKVMEDKWFIFFEDEWLYFHRSWTGECVYELRLEPSNAHYRIAEVWVNDELKGKRPFDESLLLSLIDHLLLA